METRVIRIEIKVGGATLAGLGSLLLLGALLALIWTTGTAVADPGSQGGVAPQEGSAIAGRVDTEIYYQGRLEGASGPVTMTFSLWKDETSTAGGDRIWTAEKTVTVTNGLFNTQLGDDPPHLTQGMFDGQELWLDVKVNGEQLTPRQEILPVPYALSLRPGAYIVADTGNTILTVVNDGDGKAADFTGNLGQDLEGNGLIKAAVHVYCDDNSTLRGIKRAFNSVSNDAIEFVDGAGEGRCVLRFPFDVNERYIVATANITTGTSRRGVMIRNSEIAPFNEVEFWRYDAVNGNGAGGDIAVLVY